MNWDEINAELSTILRVIALLGFIATGVLTISVFYKLHRKYFKLDWRDKMWPFYLLSIFAVVIYAFIYAILFTESFSTWFQSEILGTIN